jgi:CBS domain-containing protein
MLSKPIGRRVPITQSAIAEQLALGSEGLTSPRRARSAHPVDESGNLAGILTEGDFLRRRETETLRRRPRWIEFLVGPGKLAEEYVHASGRRVDDVMTTEVYSVSEDTPLDEVVAIMEQRRIKRVPVVRGKQVVGISHVSLFWAL